MKKYIQLIVFVFSLIVATATLGSCGESESSDYPDVQVGTPAVTDIELNQSSQRTFILKGGNGKYTVNVADSKIATATISLDTLRVTGVLEGTTYLTVISHDKRQQVNITVTYPELGVSQEEINLVPGLQNKTISISGGGEQVTLEEVDPSDAIEIKWYGTSGILEIVPKYEGEAQVIATAQDGVTKKTIQVNVRPEGEITEPGIYATDASTYYATAVNNVMVVKRKGVGVWIVNSARPYGGRINGMYDGNYMRIKPVVNPVQGDSIDLNVAGVLKATNISTGIHRLLVQEVRENEVLLRGRGYKFLLPYEKQ